MHLLRNLEVVALDLPQDQLLDPVEVEEVIVEGDPDALNERLGGVVVEEAMQATNGAKGLSAMPLLQAVDELTEDVVLGAQVLLFGARAACARSAPLDPVLRISEPHLSSSGLSLVLRDAHSTIEDAHVVQGFADAQATADASLVEAHGVPIAMQVDIALDVHATLMKLVDLGDVRWQRSQRWLLRHPERAGRRPEVPPELEVRCVAPRAKLRVEVAQVGEGAPLVEVVLDVVEGTLDATRAIRIAELVRLEDEAEAVGERSEDRGWHSILGTALGDDH